MKISVIIPVYNVEKYIARCIESILSQTFQDFEIVIVNDCTPDKSMEIVRRYAEQDNRIKIFEYEENSGPMWARMVGYTNAQGEYFVFCDSDDTLPQDALGNLYNAIIKDKADIAISNFNYIKDGVITHSSNLKLLQHTEYSCIAIYKSLLIGDVQSSLWGKIYSKSLFENIKYKTLKNQTNGEDGMLLFQILSNAKKIVFIDKCTYNYHINLASATMTMNQEKVLQSLKALNYTSKIIEKSNELYELNKKKIMDVILIFIKLGFSKRLIINNIDQKISLSLSCLSKYYCGITLLKNYLLLNSCIARYAAKIIIGKIKKLRNENYQI